MKSTKTICDQCREEIDGRLLRCFLGYHRAAGGDLGENPIRRPEPKPITSAPRIASRCGLIYLREKSPMAKDKDPHWIEHAHLDEGALRRETHTPAGKDISEKRLHAAARSSNTTERKRAELAETLRGLNK